jgi:hypothetical protein
MVIIIATSIGIEQEHKKQQPNRHIQCKTYNDISQSETTITSSTTTIHTHTKANTNNAKANTLPQR